MRSLPIPEEDYVNSLAASIILKLRNKGYDTTITDHIKDHDHIKKDLHQFIDDAKIWAHNYEAFNGNLKNLHTVLGEQAQILDDLRTRVAVLEGRFERGGTPT